MNTLLSHNEFALLRRIAKDSLWLKNLAENYDSSIAQQLMKKGMLIKSKSALHVTLAGFGFLEQHGYKC